jgi:hypothetical protein
MGSFSWPCVAKSVTIVTHIIFFQKHVFLSATMADLERNQRATENPISALRGLWHAGTGKAKKDAIDLTIWSHRIQIFLAQLISDKGGCFDLQKTPR